ncbi:MAG: DUF2779 domain-containing protein [Desulfomonilaceae bacterium]
MSYRLSKSRILAGLQCPKRLYLEVHQPQLAEELASTEQVQWWGDQVHEVARSLYHGGILIGHDHDLSQALAQTKKILDESESSPLFEATFESDGVLIRSDILFPDPRNAQLIEVKAATGIQDNHLEDCTIQAWVIENAGIPLTKIDLARVDTSFIYKGDENYDGLLLHEDVTGPVRKMQNLVSDWVREFRRVLEGPVPETVVGVHCKDPYDCPFLNHCSGVQPEYPVSILPYGRKIVVELLAEGIFDIRDIPPGRFINLLQEKVRRVTISGIPELDSQAREIIKNLPYPRYYLDFETIQFAVPIWAGTSAYQQLPFQWSCHVKRAGGALQHKEFLDTSGDPPMRAFAESLLATVGSKGPILIYSSFEKTILKLLSRLFPDLANPLNGLIDRLVDLLSITRKHYYHPAMKGSWSIKSVLPCVAPDLTYNCFEEVRDGQAAQRAYLQIINPESPEDRWKKLEEELANYCQFDTLAMVRLARYFQNS